MKYNRSLLTQILIWTGLFLIFFNISNYWQPIPYALISGLFDTLCLFIIYKTTVLLLYPKYYGNQKRYLVISLGVIAILSAIYFLIDNYAIPRVADTNHTRPPIIFFFLRIYMVNSFTFFIATSASLMEDTNRLRENEKKLTEEKLKTELQLLKAQINPHFIFNALNNIYSLTYMKAQHAPDAVLKLSEMLRYVFYDCSKERVLLTSEIKYIENFISFQQMKSENTQNIKLSVDLKSSHQEIAPMLFIPFIENAFKYSRIEELEDGFVSIKITADSDKIDGIIENTFDENNRPLAGSGTGIPNVKHRLNIIYPQKHNLEISEQTNRYSVVLSIGI